MGHGGVLGAGAPSVGALAGRFDRRFDSGGGGFAFGFAIASGVDPKAGLYTTITAGEVAALCGGSSVQITGPTGAMAVILVGIVDKYSLEKVWLAGAMAGCTQIALGVAKLGRLVKFIPYPVTASRDSRVYQSDCHSHFLRAVE